MSREILFLIYHLTIILGILYTLLPTYFIHTVTFITLFCALFIIKILRLNKVIKIPPYFFLRGRFVLFSYGILNLAVLYRLAFPWECNNIPDKKNIVSLSLRRNCENLKAKKDDCLFSSYHPFDIVLATDNNRLFITHAKYKKINKSFEILNLKTQKHILLNLGYYPQQLLVNPVKKEVYIGNWGGSEIYIISENTLKVKKILRPCKRIADIEIDPVKNRLLAVCEKDKILSAYSLDNFKKLKTVKLKFQSNVYSMAINSKSRKIYVGDWSRFIFQEIDADKLTLLRKKWIGFSAYGIAIDENKNLLYIGRPIYSRIDLIDGKTLKIVDKIPVGRGVRDIEIDEKKHLLFAGNYLDGSVDVVNLKTKKIIKHSRIGKFVRGIYYSKNTGQLFAVSMCGIFEIRY